MPTRFDRGLGPQYVRAYTSANEDLMSEPPGTRIYFNASTATLARDGMSLRPDRWRVDNYHRAGGPVLWAHEHKMPAIGSGEAERGPQRLRVGVVFDQEDPFAKSVESKVRRKFIRGSSVGWDFVSEDGVVIPRRRDGAGTLARDAFYDLSELSIVNVPADPHAVSERMYALRSIHPGLATLLEEQEREDSDLTADHVREAVLAYWRALGLPPIDGINGDSDYVRRSDLVELIRAAAQDMDEEDDEDEDLDEDEDDEDEDSEDDDEMDEDEGEEETEEPERMKKVPYGNRSIDATHARTLLAAFGDALKPAA